MLKIAVLDETLSAQINENQEYKKDFEVVFSGKDLNQFYTESNKLFPQAVIIDMDLMENVSISELKKLIEKSNSEYAIVLYSYEKKAFIEQLNTEFSKAVKKPVNLSILKIYLLNLIVKEMSREREKKNQELKTFKDKFYSTGNESKLTQCKTHLKNIISEISELESISRTEKIKTNEKIFEILEIDTSKAKEILNNSFDKIAV